MRIAFICGSLEKGADGVGDYVRRIADEMILKNHEVLAFAINDPFVNKYTKESMQKRGASLICYRFPVNGKKNGQFNSIAKLLQVFKPDWISLQYVGFAYNKFGLPLYMLYQFRKLKAGVGFHIMLHELWCGMDKFAGKKEKLLGIAQKSFLQLLIRKLKPSKTFTNIEVYSDYLKKIGIDARVVPVFGNIPIAASINNKELNTLLTTSGIKRIIEEREKWMIVSFFGTIYPAPGLHQLLRYVVEASSIVGRKTGVLLIGHNRMEKGTALVKSIEEIECCATGSIAPEMIHDVIQFSNFGILTSPANRINKSGSGMAFLERGIPLLVAKDDQTYSPELMRQDNIFQINNSDDVLAIWHGKKSKGGSKRLAQAVDAYVAL